MSFTRLAAALAVVAATCSGTAQAQTQADPMPPITGPASPSPLQPGDAFGAEVTLPERTMIYIQGHSNWDTAFELNRRRLQVAQRISRQARHQAEWPGDDHLHPDRR